MIISDVYIENYRSLKKINLENLETFVILTGKNSSGKSNLLEALWLFSRDFALSPELININAPLDANSNLWTNAETDNPIIFKIKIRFTPQETREFLPSEIIDVLNLSRKTTEVTIERQIIASPPNISWKIISLSLFDIIIIKKGKPVNQLSPYIEEEIIERVGKNGDVVSSSMEYLPSDLIKDTEQLTKAEQIFKNTNIDVINSILENITKLFKDNIKIIFSSRTSPSSYPNYSSRNLNIEQQIYNKILNEGQNLNASIRHKWRKFVSEFEKLIPYEQRLSVVAGQAIVDEANVTLPVMHIGGGTQTILGLIHELYFESKSIIFIEEPENHLHPELQKKLFNYLIHNISPRSVDKQIWISTHSPFFLNKSDLKKIWFVTKINNNTEIKNLSDREDLKKIILALGVKPSDVLFSDALLLVEGTTEEFVIPIWAKKLGVDLIDLGCELIGIGGGNKGKYHLDMWRSITKDAQIPIFLILDKHAKQEIDKLISEGKIEREFCLSTSKNSIEEFYPKDYVIKAIYDEFGIEFEKNELKNTKENTIKKLLINQGMIIERNWWKPLIGKRVAEIMNVDQIPIEYKIIIERIKLQLMVE